MIGPIHLPAITGATVARFRRSTGEPVTFCGCTTTPEERIAATRAKRLNGVTCTWCLGRARKVPQLFNRAVSL